MGSCVWIVGRCPRKTEENFTNLSRSYGIPVIRCRNLREVARHLCHARYPSLLICGPDVPKFAGETASPVPVLRMDDSAAEHELETYLRCAL